VGRDQRVQGLVGRLVGGLIGAPAILQRGELGVEDVVEQRILGPVVEVHAALAQPGLAGDVEETCRREAAAYEAPRGGSPDLLLADLIGFLACHRPPTLLAPVRRPQPQHASACPHGFVQRSPQLSRAGGQTAPFAGPGFDEARGPVRGEAPGERNRAAEVPETMAISGPGPRRPGSAI
jgi:hypothetical protein